MTAQMAGEMVKVWQAHVLADVLADTLTDAPAPASTAKPGTLLAIDESGLQVACGAGVLCLTQLQKPGGKRQPVADFVRHFKGTVGDVFQS
jgi:methionyl-tRNA formyltransferase